MGLLVVAPFTMTVAGCISAWGDGVVWHVRMRRRVAKGLRAPAAGAHQQARHPSAAASGAAQRAAPWLTAASTTPQACSPPPYQHLAHTCMARCWCLQRAAPGGRSRLCATSESTSVSDTRGTCCRPSTTGLLLLLLATGPCCAPRAVLGPGLGLRVRCCEPKRLPALPLPGAVVVGCWGEGEREVLGGLGGGGCVQGGGCREDRCK